MVSLIEAVFAEGKHELARAQGRRGVVYLTLELGLGDNGEPLWTKSALYFERKRHVKDARERPNDEA